MNSPVGVDDVEVLSADAGEQASSLIKSSSTQSSVISHPSSYSEKAAKNEHTYHISTKTLKTSKMSRQRLLRVGFISSH